MNRKKKLLVLLLLSLSVFFVYKFSGKKHITYTVLGDSFSMGENSYGGYTYGYEDYLRDYLGKNKRIEFIDLYTNKAENIITLHNRVINNNSAVIKNKNYNMKKIISESDIITISIGLSDIIYEYYINKNVLTSQYKEDKTVKYIYNNFKILMKEILKYKNNNIYVIGYPVRDIEYERLIEKLNIMYKNYSKKNNIIFIDSDKLLNKNNYFDDKKSIFPNTNGYKVIAKKIINIYKNKEKS